MKGFHRDNQLFSLCGLNCGLCPIEGKLAPVFFGSALNTFGVKELLDCFVKIAPSPRPVEAEERRICPEEEKFSGFVFKIHANMDPNHRS